MARQLIVPEFSKPNAKRRYTTTTNEDGQIVHTTWRVWRGDHDRQGGYKSFLEEDEAREHYKLVRGARLDRVDVTIVEMADD